MKPEDPNEVYDHLESDAKLDDYVPGPFECDICLELYDPEATYMCPECTLTICEDCWSEHVVQHERENLTKDLA